MPPTFQVYIVESPSFDNLYQEKTEGRVISQGLALANIPATLRLAGNGALFRKALDPALGELTNLDTIHPLLHISSHGNNDGLVLTSGEPVAWKELREILTPLNQTLKGGLVLCMSSCFGYQAIQTVMTKGELPFSILIGNKGKISWSEAGIGYLAFYHVITRGGGIVEALDAMKKASRNDQFCVEAGHQVKERFSQSVLAGLGI